MLRHCTLFLLLLVAGVSLIVAGFSRSGETTPREVAPHLQGRAAESIEMVPETAAPPTQIIILYPLGGSAARGAIRKIFNHERHVKEFKITCSGCHHRYEDGRNVWKEGMPVKRCSKCHDDPALGGEKGLVAGFQMKKLLSQTSCIGCHMSGYLKTLERYGIFPGKEPAPRGHLVPGETR